jgi:hypothetical protein
MGKKKFLICLFLLVNILNFVYSQENKNPIPTIPEPPKNEPTEPVADPQTTTTTTTTEPAQQPQPTPETTTLTNSGTITVSTAKQTSIITSTLPNRNFTMSSMINPKPISQSVTTTKIVTVSTKAPTKTTTIVKKYPQSTYVSYNDDTEKAGDGAPMMKFIYIAGGVVSSLLVGWATFILYKKGLGDEAPTSRTWDNSYEDDGYRNKSTISRNTLTPSIRNTTLGSPNSTANTSQYR